MLKEIKIGKKKKRGNLEKEIERNRKEADYGQVS